MNEPLISVVVPVYNGEKYLKKLIESLLSQTYKNFEVLLIDDFSTDNSVETIENLIQNNEKFKIFTPSSRLKTASKSIEFALPLCKGDYYFYMSQDDFIDNECFEKCVEKALNSDADIVLPNTVFYYENKKSKKKGKFPKFGNYNASVGQKEAFYASLKWYIGGFSLRKMSLVRKIRFKAEYFNSDEFFTRKSYLYANKIAFADTNFYYRQDNENAITKVIRHNIFDIQTTDIMLAKLLIEHNFSKYKINKRFKELIKAYPGWVKLYKKNKEKFTLEEEKYVIDTLNNAKNEIEKVVKEQNLIECKLNLFFKKLEDSECLSKL